MTNEEVLDRFFHAVEEGDWEALEALYDEDLVVWHNFSAVQQDKRQNIASLKRARAVAEWRYHVTERIAIGDRIVQRHTARMRIKGQPELVSHAALFLTVRNGRVARIDEYLDAAGLEPLRQAQARR